jgi:hypothetical protein
MVLFAATAEAAYIPVPTPANTPVPTATAVPTATPPNTPVPTATAVPTATPPNTPVPTATVVPVVPTATPLVGADGLYRRPNFTVTALPTCNAGTKYAIAAVSDSLACTFASTLTGGGSQACGVFCDGANWIGE